MIPEWRSSVVGICIHAGNVDGGCPEKGNPISASVVGSDDTEQQLAREFEGSGALFIGAITPKSPVMLLTGDDKLYIQSG